MIFESLPTSTKHHRREFDVWQGLLTSRVKPIKDFINHMVEVTPRKNFANGTLKVMGWWMVWKIEWIIFVQVPGVHFQGA